MNKDNQDTPKQEPRNCWELQDCVPSVRHKCPAYTTDSGRECWMVAGSLNNEPVCPKVVNKIYFCWNCPWYQKLNTET